MSTGHVLKRSLLIVLAVLALGMNTHRLSADNYFTELTLGLPQFVTGSLLWGDYDSDGDLDLFVCGWQFTDIFRNNSGTFSALNANLDEICGWDARWIDYDGDNDLDLFNERLYRNDEGIFVQANSGLPEDAYENAYYTAWGDFDRDGDLDVFVSRAVESYENLVSAFYRNDGKGSFTEVEVGLPTDAYISIDPADVDNDGDLDLMLAKALGVTSENRVYLNQGDATFVAGSWTTELAGAGSWGDFNNDGYVDFVMSGRLYNQYTEEYYPDTSVFKNLQNNTFAVTHLEYGRGGKPAWGDYDNDGDLDVVVEVNYSSLGWFTDIYESDGTSLHSGGAVIPDVRFGDMVWGDYDKDGDLDLALSGTLEIAPDGDILRILRNDDGSANTQPTAPTGLQSEVDGNTAVLSWSAASDSQTPAAALSYNVRVGTSPGGTNIVSPLADPATGYRYVVANGNAGHRSSFTLNNLKPGVTYYWSVQAVDTAFAGSPFAAEASFTVEGDNLLLNPGFEEAYSEAGIVDERQAKNWLPKKLLAADRRLCKPKFVKSGECSFQFKRAIAPVVRRRISQRVKLSDAQSGDTFKLSAWVRGKNLVTKARLQLLVTYASGETELKTIRLGAGTYPYTQVIGDLLLDGEASHVDVTVDVRKTTGRLWLDDLNLILVKGSGLLPLPYAADFRQTD